MTEILFYHLDRQPLERVLPELLEKCVERGWRSGPAARLGGAVRGHRRASLDLSRRGLPAPWHEEGRPSRRPAVWLTTGPDNPNGATVRFLADGAEPPDLALYDRVVMLFDGNDPEAVDRARATWTAAGAPAMPPPTGSRTTAADGRRRPDPASRPLRRRDMVRRTRGERERSPKTGGRPCAFSSAVR